MCKVIRGITADHRLTVHVDGILLTSLTSLTRWYSIHVSLMVSVSVYSILLL